MGVIRYDGGDPIGRHMTVAWKGRQIAGVVDAVSEGHVLVDTETMEQSPAVKLRIRTEHGARWTPAMRKVDAQ